MYQYFYFGATDVGLCRRNNEDAFLIRPEAGFLAVADGMGGAAAGEVASEIFVDTAADLFSRTPAAGDQEQVLRVAEVFRVANERILADAARTPLRRGMGCTAELIAFCGNSYVL